jgi:hypothetical protein
LKSDLGDRSSYFISFALNFLLKDAKRLFGLGYSSSFYGVGVLSSTFFENLLAFSSNNLLDEFFGVATSGVGVSFLKYPYSLAAIIAYNSLGFGVDV